MKTTKIITTLTILLSVIALPSCNSSKNVAQQQQSYNQKVQAPQVYDPSMDMVEIDYEYDTDEYYAATGFAQGALVRIGDLQSIALQNAIEQIYAKLSRHYQGLIKNYTQNYGNDKGNDIESRLKSGAIATIEGYISEVKTSKFKRSKVDEKGEIFVEVSIKINKEELSKRLAQSDANTLTADEKAKIDFDATEHENEIKEAFKK